MFASPHRERCRAHTWSDGMDTKRIWSGENAQPVGTWRQSRGFYTLGGRLQYDSALAGQFSPADACVYEQYELHQTAAMPPEAAAEVLLLDLPRLLPPSISPLVLAEEKAHEQPD